MSSDGSGSGRSPLPRNTNGSPIALEQIDDDAVAYFVDDRNAAHPGDGRMAPEEAVLDVRD